MGRRHSSLTADAAFCYRQEASKVDTVRFCSLCAAPVTVRIPDDDNRPRHVCSSCGQIHYVNPKVVVGCIPEYEDRILLCRRAIEPRHGLWTLPAGFLECAETVEAGAARETLEEAQAVVEVGELYTVLSIPHVDQVYMMFRSTLLRPEYGPGSESLEVELFREQDIPWDKLAFGTIRRTLEYYFADRRRGSFALHVGTVTPPTTAPARGGALQTTTPPKGRRD